MNNITINEDGAMLADRSFRLTAESLVIKCGVPVDLHGFERLADAVILYGTGAGRGICDIYRRIGDVRRVRYKTVMREISYAIERADDIAVRLSELMGTLIRKTAIHNGLVIACLGRLFRAPDSSLYAKAHEFA